MSCERCSERLQALEAVNAQLERAARDVKALERRGTRDARKIADLEQRLAAKGKDERKRSEWRPVVERIFEFWKEVSGHKNALLTDDRFDAVEWCLEFGYTEERIYNAIRGYVRDPYVDEKGKVFDDLELICRKRTKHVEDGEKRLVAAHGKAVKQAGQGGADTSTPLERALLALRYEFGHDRVAAFDYTPGEWWAVCPLKPGAGEPFRLVERDGKGSSIDLACAHGCDPEELREALRSIERKRLAGGIEGQFEKAAA